MRTKNWTHTYETFKVPVWSGEAASVGKVKKTEVPQKIKKKILIMRTPDLIKVDKENRSKFKAIAENLSKDENSQNPRPSVLVH